MPSGSLLMGQPLTQYPAGSYAFRTAILVLGLDPVVESRSFVEALGRAVAATISGATLRDGDIAVGSSFQQEAPRDDGGQWAVELERSIYILGTVAGVGGIVRPDVAAVGSAGVLAWILGAAIGHAAAAFVPTHIPARWVTVSGTVDSPGSIVRTEAITQAIVVAMNETLRLRVPRAPFQEVAPQAESVLARTRELGACTGHKRFDKVIAAACTRLEPTAPRAIVVPSESYRWAYALAVATVAGGALWMATRAKKTKGATR